MTITEVDIDCTTHEVVNWPTGRVVYNFDYTQRTNTLASVTVYAWLLNVGTVLLATSIRDWQFKTVRIQYDILHYRNTLQSPTGSGIR